MGRFESIVSRVVNYLGSDKWSASISSNVLWYYIEFRYKGEPSMVGGYSYRPECDKEAMYKNFLDTWIVSGIRLPLPDVPKSECEKLRCLKSSSYSELDVKLTLMGCDVKDLFESRILRTDDFFNVTEKFGMFVRRVMNVVGADTVVFREIDGYLSMSLTKKPAEFVNDRSTTVVFGPLFSPSEVESLSVMCRLFLEANFLDTDNGNKMFAEMYGFNHAVDAVKKDDFGLLSKTFSELEIKQALQGA